MRRRLARLVRIARNAADLVVGDAARSWARNRRTVAPAVGSMCVLLLLAGLGGLAAVAVDDVLRSEASDASVVRVYLRDGASGADVYLLEQRLQADDRVRTVRYVSPEQALREAQQRPGLAQLVTPAGGNPFPASLDVTVRALGDAGPLVARFQDNPAIDPAFPSSYDATGYQQLQSFIAVTGAIALGVLVVLAAVAAAVTANTIRAAILARRDDVTIMRLVGASGWMVRGPFVVEGTLTGTVAGLLGGAAVVGIFAAVQAAGAQAFTDLLPGVTWPVALACAGVLPLAGMALGSAASVAGLRGLTA